MNKKNKNPIKQLMNFFCIPLIPALVGFGIYFWYLLNNANVFFAVLVAVYISALTTRVFFNV